MVDDANEKLEGMYGDHLFLIGYDEHLGSDLAH